MNLYLTFFFTKNELAMRVGYLFVSAAIAGALGGLLAFGIGNMDGIQGLSGWRVSPSTITLFIRSKSTKQ